MRGPMSHAADTSLSTPRYLYVLHELHRDILKHEIEVTTDHWVEFTRIFDSNGDGVLQLDEFIDFCRFQVIALYFSNQDRTREDDNAAKKELRDLKRRQPFMIPIYPKR